MRTIFQSIFKRNAVQGIVLPQEARPLLRPLEPRVLLDAAAAETSFDLAERAVLENQASEYIEAHTIADTALDAVEADAIAPPLERDRRDEIVFIDSNVENKGQIIGSLDPSVRIVIIDNESDGVEQIAAALEGVSDISAIHIISHGDSGSLNLGSGELNQESILGEHQDELAIIRETLTEDGDILIYGCNFGAGEEGREAAQALAFATGADIAASDDLTGAESLGGDWDLELHTGEVETQNFEAQNFEGVLAGINQDAPSVEAGAQNTSIVFSTANGNAPSLASNIGTTATVTLTSTNGTLSLSSTSGLNFTAGDGTDDTSLTFQGLITDINAALDGLTFKPNADFIGDAEIQMDSVAGVEDIHLATNHGFEEPDTPTESIRFIDDADVPGWSTTDVEGKIEIWNDAGGVQAFEGDQFIEINAFSAGTLSQTVSRNAGDPLEYSFAHRGRAGVDTVNATITDLGADGILGTADDVVLLDKNYSTGNTAWSEYSEDLGTASGNDILIEMTAVSSASSSNAAGNFLDAVDLSFVEPDTTASSRIGVEIQVDTDGDGIANVDDIDDDNDGILDVNEQIEYANGGRLTAEQRAETFGPYNQAALSSIDQNFTGLEGNQDNESIGETQTYNFELPLSNVSFGVRSLDIRASYGDFTVTYADGTVDNNVAFTIKDPADYTAEELAFVTPSTGGSLALEVDADGNNVVRGTGTNTNNQGVGILLFNTDPTRLVTSIALTNLSDPNTAINSGTRVNIFGSPTFVNRDQDSVADSVDLDSDNDGISDAHESGFVVAEQARLQAIIDDNAASAADKTTASDRLTKLSEIFADGTITEQESSDYLSIGEDATIAGDADNDGLMDIFDANTNNSDGTASVGTTPIDSDNDGLADFNDLDSDGDGIADAIEARTTAGFIANDGTDASNADADGDGVLDIFDTNSTFGGTDGNFNAPVDTDKDGTADYLDTDSDGDGINDADEGLKSADTLTYENPDGSASSSNSLGNVLENEHGNQDELAYREIGVVATNDTATTNEDTTLTVNEQSGLLANDDSAGELLITSLTVGTQTVTAGTAISLTEGTLTVNSNGSYTFVPAANYHGTVPTVTYTVQSTLGELTSTTTATLVITVTPVNDIPTVNPGTNGAGGPGAGTDDENDPLGNQSSNDHDTVSIDVKPNFTDNDTEDTLTYTATGLPEGLSIVNGVITGTIDSSASTGGPNGDGVYTIAVTADDGNGGTVTDTFTYTIANPAPMASNDTGSVDEGETLTVTAANGLLSNDSDADSVDDNNPDTTEDTLKITSFIVEGQENALTAGETATIAGVGTVTVNADGSYEFVPEENFNGEVPTITYTAEDSDGAKDTATLDLTVNAVNDAPTVTSEPADISDSDSTQITPIDLSQNFSDVDGDDLNYQAAGLPAGLTLDPATGMITGTLASSASKGGVNQDGVYEVTVTAFDGDPNDPNTLSVTTSFTYSVTNPTPTTADDNINVNEDTPATGNVLSNDSDPDGDELSVTGFSIDGVAGEFAPGETATIPGKGTITIDEEGGYTFTPEPNYNGPVPNITYNVEDADGATSSADLKITVTDVNDPPVIVTTEDGAADPLPDQSDNDGETITPINAAANFEDADGDSLNYVATGLPAGLSINPATGEITGTLDKSASTGGPNDNGVYSVSVTASDGQGGIVTDTFTYTVANPAPIASDDSISVEEDNDAIGNVLSNDSDADGDANTVTHFTIDGLSEVFQPGQTATIEGVGTVKVNVDGSYIFSPVDNYNGTVPTITYTVEDPDGGLDTADLVITVTAVNDGPNVVVTEGGAGGPGAGTNDPNDPLGNQNTTDGTLISPIDVTSNFTDIDNDDLTYTAEGLPEGLTISADGTITGAVDGNASTGGPNDDGVYSVTVTVSDGNGGTVTDTFTYTVANPGPTAVADSASANEDTIVNGNVISNDSDVDGDDLIVTGFLVAGQTEPIVAGQTATIDGVGTIKIDADGAYVFTPVKNFNGEVPEVTYTLQDEDGGTASAPLNIDIVPVNDAPVVTSGVDEDGNPIAGTDDPNDPLGNQSDSDGTLIAPIDVTSNFTDVDGDDLSYQATGLPAGLTLDPTTGIISGTLDASASQGGPNDDGVYTVSIIVSDGNGGLVTDTFTYTVDNPAPVANNDTVNVAEDAAGVEGNVLGNDNDPDGDTLTVSKFTIAGVTGEFEPGVSVTLMDPNDPTVTAGTIILNSDGSYSFTPAENYEGEVPVINYTAVDADGSEAEATLTITIEAENDVPTLTTSLPDLEHVDGTNLEGDNAIDISANFADVEDDQSNTNLAFSTTDTLPPGLELTADGTLKGTIDNSASQGGDDGVYTITVTATDSTGAMVSDTFTFTVTNPAPEAANDTVTVSEDAAEAAGSAGITGNVLTNDSDADDEISVQSFIVEGQTSPIAAGGTATIAGVGTVSISAEGNYTFVPVENYNGTVPPITYTVSDDDGATTSADLNITVSASNDKPTVVTGVDENGNSVDLLPAQTGTDSAPISTIDLAPNFTDVDGDDLTFTVDNLPPGLMLSDDGKITGTLDKDASTQGDNGTNEYTITVTASDGNGGTITDTFTFTVENPAPVATGETIEVDEDQPATGNLLDNDSDVDGDELSITQIIVDGQEIAVPANGEVSQAVEGGMIVVAFDGTYTFTPNENFNGSIPTIQYVVTDADGKSAPAVDLNITVNPVNDAPEVTSGVDENGNPLPGTDDPNDPLGNASGTDGQAIETINTADNFTDIEGDTLTYTATGLPAGLSIDPETGEITGTISPSASSGGDNGDGTYTVSVTVSDGNGGTVTDSFTYTVENPAPTTVDVEASTNQGAIATGNVLTDASDPDGDELSLSSFTVEGLEGETFEAGDTATIPGVGTIKLNLDGSYVFTPEPGFSGSVPAIGFTVMDTDGGTSTSQLSLTVIPRPVIDVPAAIQDGDDFEENDRDNRGLQNDPIEVEGIVLKTVQDIQDLNRGSTFDEISPERSLSAEFNDKSIFSLHNSDQPSPLVGDTLAIDIGQFNGDTLIAEGLIDEQIIDSISEGNSKLQLFVNTFVRQDILFIDISSNDRELYPAKIKRYTVTALDGSKLPDWVKVAEDGFVIVETPLNVKSLDLIISAELEDGTDIKRAITVESVTGVIQMANIDGNDAQKISSLSRTIRDNLGDKEEDLL